MDIDDIEEHWRRAKIFIGEAPGKSETSIKAVSVALKRAGTSAIKAARAFNELASISANFSVSKEDMEKLKEFFFEGGDEMPRRDPTLHWNRRNIPKYTTVLGHPISAKVITHTEMRFNTMTEIQLWTRMGKITNEEKLLAFAYVADERGIDDLSMAALARYVRLTGDNSVMEAKLGKAKKEPKKDEKTDRLLRRMDV